MNQESWRAVYGYEGRYEVSDAGRVRSLPRTKVIRGHVYRWPGRCMKPFIDTNTRYLCVNLGDGSGGVKKIGVHVLVLEAFVSPRPNGLIALHADGNRQNPAISNLRWGTYKDNSADSIRHGTFARGEKSSHAILNAELVEWIRDSRQSSLSLAPILGVASSTIRAVRIAQNWRHL